MLTKERRCCLEVYEVAHFFWCVCVFFCWHDVSKEQMDEMDGDDDVRCADLLRNCGTRKVHILR